MVGGTNQVFMGVVAQCLQNKGCAVISMRERKAREIMSFPPIVVNEKF